MRLRGAGMNHDDKIKYHSKKKALKHLNRIRKWGMIIPKNAHAYLCPYCKHWHLGHDKFMEA